ncbi:MAG: transporter substrate-binding domain-containing protein [Alphaproteobacteria bacterium]
MNKHLVTAVIAGCVAFAVAWMVRPDGVGDNTHEQSTFERVMKSKTIRCGYFVWPPHLVKDPNTGEMSGIYADLLESLAQQMSLKIEWAEEMGWGDMPAALNANRIDMYCMGAVASPARAREIDFVKAPVFTPFYPTVRWDDVRFDHETESKLNQAKVTFVMGDGGVEKDIIRNRFPDAKILSLPQTASFGEFFLSVADRKADVVLMDENSVAEYNKGNPSKKLKLLKQLRAGLFDGSLPVKRDDGRFRDMMNEAIGYSVNTGELEAIVRKYDQAGAFYMLAPIYEEK